MLNQQVGPEADGSKGCGVGSSTGQEGKQDSGFRIQGRESRASTFFLLRTVWPCRIQDSGFGIQEIELRSQDKEEMTVRLVLAPNARKNDWLMLCCS